MCLSTSIISRDMSICRHMKCPFCKHRTSVVNSRGTKSKPKVWRRRQCQSCNRIFTTQERPNLDGIIAIESKDGELSSYSFTRLLVSIVKSGINMPIPSDAPYELATTIEAGLLSKGYFSKKFINKLYIEKEALTALSRYNKIMAMQYVNNIYNYDPPSELLQFIAIDKPM